MGCTPELNAHIATTIRLLIVEDNRAYLRFVQIMFAERQGRVKWEVTTAADGERALHLLLGKEKEPLPDLILLDWNLPKVTGNDVLRSLKEHKELRKIPVIVFSSSEAPKDIRDAYGNHANGYITKPADLDAMASVVESIEQFWAALVQLPKVSR